MAGTGHLARVSYRQPYGTNVSEVDVKTLRLERFFGTTLTAHLDVPISPAWSAHLQSLSKGAIVTVSGIGHGDGRFNIYIYPVHRVNGTSRDCHRGECPRGVTDSFRGTRARGGGPAHGTTHRRPGRRNRNLRQGETPHTGGTEPRCAASTGSQGCDVNRIGEQAHERARPRPPKGCTHCTSESWCNR